MTTNQTRRQTRGGISPKDWDATSSVSWAIGGKLFIYFHYFSSLLMFLDTINYDDQQHEEEAYEMGFHGKRRSMAHAAARRSVAVAAQT
jgi:hypothetical protein